MFLAVGTRLGPYEVLAPIGAGGMGEVYRARDTRLKRDVALKVLPEAFACDDERMARFQREAEVLASLNHPNIAAIYGVETRTLVMELVEGSTLSGPLPVDTALNYARQMAEGLEAAHDKGIIHRDLKPTNVKVTPEGVVKILDFGLAKAADDSSGSLDPANSPTLTVAPTGAGVILGTVAYMSPEQAHGKVADRRSDIWSFGVVLYEMLSGKQPFSGESVSDTLASVLKLEPDWEALPAHTPPPIRKLVQRCLIKDRKRRLQAIGEARITIDECLAEPARAVSVPMQAKRGPSTLPWIVAAAALAAAAVLGFMAFREAPPEHEFRFTIAALESVHTFAISPDGQYIAIAAGGLGKRQLWLRPIDALAANPIPTTEEASYPFWSPDSRYIGFFAKGKLRKIAVSGGPAQSICDAPDGRGGSWGRDDVIIFSPNGSDQVGIQRVGAAGGIPSNVTKEAGLQRFPSLLPDGRHFLYLLSGPSAEMNGLYFASVDDSERRRILADQSSAVFAPVVSGADTGHLLFIRGNTLVAQPFDAGRGELSGDALPVAEAVFFQNLFGFAAVSVSNNGVLLYSNGTLGVAAITSIQLVWYDRAGKSLNPPAPGDPTSSAGILTPALSADGKMMAFSRAVDAPGAGDIWLRDLVRGTDIRLTSDAAGHFGPVWSRKGNQLTFTSNAPGQYKLLRKSTTPSAQSELLLSASGILRPYQYAPDGKFVVYGTTDPKTKLDLMLLPIGGGPGEQKPMPLLHSEFNELHGQFSPDQRWIAYTSDASGRREIYVQPFPALDRVSRISIGGGDMPRWRGDGKELFFVGAGGTMMAVPVRGGAGSNPSFEAGIPAPLFESNIISGDAVNIVFQYDVTADGQRFAVVTNANTLASAPQPLSVVVNWNSSSRK